MKESSEGRNPQFDELLKMAEVEKWDFVDAHIGNFITAEYVRWAIQSGLYDPDQNVRDLAATILDESDLPLEGHDIHVATETMEHDVHHIVRYRMAIALYKRGNRSPQVTAMMEEATKDPELGELAQKYYTE